MPIVYNRHSAFRSWYAGVVTFGLDNISSASAMTTTGTFWHNNIPSASAPTTPHAHYNMTT